MCDLSFPQSVLKVFGRYARGFTAPWHFLWQNSKEKSAAKTKVEAGNAEDFDIPRPRSVEKAVVFALFNASLDRKSVYELHNPHILTSIQCVKLLFEKLVLPTLDLMAL